jgi:tetratricopeptide (TPR) repeat protein
MKNRMFGIETVWQGGKKMIVGLFVCSIIGLVFASCEKPETTFNKGVASYNNGDWDKAVSYFNKIIEKEPAYKQVYLYRGMTYRQLKQNMKAVDDLTQAITEDETEFLAFCERGFCYYDLEKYEEAAADLKYYVSKVDTAGVDAYRILGKSYFYLEQSRNAVNAFTKALEIAPDNFESYANRGLSYYNLSDYSAAVRDLTKALELEPNNEGVQAGLVAANEAIAKEQANSFWNWVSPYVNNSMQNALDRQNRKINQGW